MKYVLSNTTLAWLVYLYVAADANIPATFNELESSFFATFKVAKTCKALKRELAECKYIHGVSSLPMINKCQSIRICNKLEWPLPMNLRQFVVSRETENFDQKCYMHLRMKCHVFHRRTTIDTHMVLQRTVALNNNNRRYRNNCNRFPSMILSE